MALHGQVLVNGYMLGYWSAERVWGDRDPAAKPNPAEVLTYRCEVSLKPTLEGNPAVDWRGEVTHRYGDGALALAARVLTQASVESHVQL